MTKTTLQPDGQSKPLTRLLPHNPSSPAELQTAIQELEAFRTAAQVTQQHDLAQAAEVLQQLLEIALLSDQVSEQNPTLAQEIIQFVQTHLPLLAGADSTPNTGRLAEMIAVANSRWTEYLGLSIPAENPIASVSREADDADWTAFPELDPASEFTVDSPPADEGLNAEDIGQLLALVQADTRQADPTAMADEQAASFALDLSAPPGPAPTGREQAIVAGTGFEVRDPAPGNTDSERLPSICPELWEAFLEDASRGLAGMEQAALILEQASADLAARRQFARELHTLKGAAASVGLDRLAADLHQLESTISESGEGNSFPVDRLFLGIDRVREVMRLGGVDGSNGGAIGTELKRPEEVLSPAAPRRTSALADRIAAPPKSASEEALIRIRVSKFDRLMDMLAELVVLRSRRESNLAQFHSLIEELARCSTRLSHCDEGGWVGGSSDKAFSEWHSARSLTEIARDLLVLSRDLQTLQKPLGQDNQAIAGFIRNFRQELIQLRRIPMSGLFAKLQRAVRDAARVEGKQVQLQVLGEDAGLEQELQERLYEPLLHLVRNGVSHGIETEAVRRQAGKPAQGRITLETRTSPQLLVVEIRDDGAGLNDEAIRRRAIERGLLAEHQPATSAELARCIFVPGFSTCDQASSISGRGVGMDVVASTIESLRGRVDVDSRPGRGTTFRISIPLRSGIEHVMLFRSGGQLFALPMQGVSAAQAGRETTARRFSLADLLTTEPYGSSDTREVLLLRDGGQGLRSLPGRSSHESRWVGLEVDEIVGPEEVVVRGLPTLLKHHPLFCGLTLSGSNEPVMLLDHHRLLDFFHRHLSESPAARHRELPPTVRHTSVRRALIVDDSLSARKVLVKKLGELGIQASEAADGVEGLERLRQDRFDLIVTDLDMPRLGGLEMIFDIQRGNYGQAPILVVSSRPADPFRRQVLEQGAAEYLSKPVADEALRQALSDLHLLDRSPLESQTKVFTDKE